ncbi:hypothetical protein [Kingella negevensis]|uniref:Lipoprotein n=1 Tax=Kingella negevensis TaxID=1522312 RepID=A0A238HFX1_9NEIS|nr:hypothetical protein [Kingella negevensis]MDK4681204.1 hypothetical protein [Kingella negevensis]MDK4683401.1 hypothetical protein [Kingella negevensis]MDK4685055.1 hypothetical protein [Kingella negevensis]MDK4689528.1 hypothetical protein [Kingella negevensis]MDK4691464.1 hypothetical protein [Kingella negevensis]
MKKVILFSVLAGLLAACSGTGGSSQMYGEIKGGVESSKFF